MTAMVGLLQHDFMGTDVWLWLAFVTVVLALLAFDLGVLHREAREVGVRESLMLSAGYIGIGLLFALFVGWQLGGGAATEYVTAFLVEKSLALDNVFVIALIFSYFAIPRKYQHRVLFWGILGVIVLRALMIGAGAALLAEFSWIMYLFGAFLLITGIKMLSAVHDMPDIGSSRLIQFARRRLRVTPELHGDRFVVRVPASDRPGTPSVWRATPLLLALIVIELADLMFAVDSVPAVFAITQNPFIVYTSNIFAILGLRALYFALDAVLHRFTYLKYALALVLVFIGGKIFYTQWFGKLDPAVSLGVTVGLLAAGVALSLFKTRGIPQAATLQGRSGDQQAPAAEQCR